MSSMCVDCGLCCDGTLFAQAPLRPDDLAPPAGVHAVAGEPSYFRQPCAALDHRVCTIYDDRPTVCRNYRCKLLKAVESGSTTVEDARTIIATTIELRDRVRPAIEAVVRSEMPLALPTLYPMLETRFAMDDEPTDRTARVNLLLDVAGLRMLLHTHFEGQPGAGDASTSRMSSVVAATGSAG